MKTKFLVLAAFIAVIALSIVSASTGNLDVSVSSLTIRGVELASGSTVNVAGFSGEIVPLKVIFSSNVDASDAKVKVWIGGYRDEIASSTRRIHLLNNSVYSEILSLKLPSDIDPSESYTLYVRIETKTSYKEEQFNLKLQRESYTADILDIDSENTVKAGEKLAIDVVLKNVGYEQLDDLFVVASINELGTSKKAYFEDLMAVDDPQHVTRDRRDSAERTIYLRIPENAETGVYDLTVEVYNSETREIVTKKIAVVSNEQKARVIVPITSKTIAVGSTESFDLIIVNSGNNIGVYEIVPEVSDGIIVNADKPIVTIRAGNSETIKLNVKALKEGTYKIKANVESDGNIIKNISLSAVAEKQKQAFLSNNAIVLTIVLAIVFVVLLIVLIVLLTRKPARSEAEESYY